MDKISLGSTFVALEKLKRDIGETAPTAEIVLDETGTVIECKGDCRIFLGIDHGSDASWPSDVFFLMPKFQLDGAISKTLFKEHLQRAIALENESEKHTFDWLFKKIDGRYFQARLTCSPGKISGEKIIRCNIQMLSDEGAGADTGKDLGALLDHAPNVVFFIDEDLDIITCNRFAVDAFGMRDKKDFTENFIKNFTPRYQNSILSKDFLRIQVSRAFDEGESGNAIQFNWNIKRETSETLGSIKLVATEYQGRPCCVAFLSEFTSDDAPFFDEPLDIALFDKTTRALLEDMPLVWMFYDADLNCIECNKAASDYFGFKDKQGLISNYLKILPLIQPCDTASTEKFKQHAKEASEKNFTTFEFTFKKLDSVLLSAEVMLVAVNAKGRLAYAANIRDLSEIKTLKRMRNSESDKVQAVVASIPAPFTFWSENRKLTLCNQAVANLFGLKTPQDYLNIFHKLSPSKQPCGTNSQKLALQYVNEAFDTGHSNFDWIHQKLDGTKIPCRVSLTRVLWQGGLGLIGFTTDLREEQAKEERLQKRVQRLSSILDGLPGICAFWDENLDMITVSQGTLELFGLPNREEFFNKVSNLYPEKQPDGRPSIPTIKEYLRKTLKEGRVVFDWMHQDVYGRLIPTRAVMTRVEWQGGYGVAGYLRDLREENRIKEEKRAEEEQFFAVLNSLPAAIHLWDENHNLIFCNDFQIESLVFENREDYINNFFDSYPEKQPCGRNSVELSKTIMKNAFKFGRYKTEWTIKNKRGELIHLDCTLSRVKWGSGYAVIEFCRDMREQDQERKAQRAFQERMQLILDSVPLGASIREIDGGVIDCNQAAVDLFSFADKQEYITNFNKLSPKYQPCGLLSTEKRNKMIGIAFEKGKHRFSWLFEKLDGTQIPAEVTMVRIVWQGKPMICSFFQDAREAIKSSEQQQRAIAKIAAMVNASPMMGFVCDENHNLVYCNEAAYHLVGLPDKQSFIECFSKLHPMQQPCGTSSEFLVSEHFKTAFEKGKHTWEWWFKTASGEMLPTECSATCIEIDGTRLLMVYCGDLRSHYKYKEDQKSIKTRLDAMLNASPMACLVLDESLNVLDCNQAAVEFTGVADKVGYISRFSDFHPMLQPDGSSSAEMMAQRLNEVMVKGKIDFEWTFLTIHGEAVPSQVHAQKVVLDDKNCFIVYVRDMREFLRAQEERHTFRQRLEAMLDASPLACAITNDKLQTLLCNESVVQLFRVSSKQEFIEKFHTLSPDFQPGGRKSAERGVELMNEFFANNQSMRFEWMHRTVDGEDFPCEVTFKPVNLDGQDMLLCYMNDLRDLHKAVDAAETLEKLAYHDGLTGAHNHRYFYETAEREMNKCKAEGAPFSLIYLDIDNFKMINDTYGHTVGDGILKILVSRVSNTLRKEAVITRYGGEEFVIIMPGINVDDAKKTAWRIRDGVEAAKFMVEGLQIDVTVSVGLAQYDPKDSLSTLVIKADTALYAAKSCGKNTVVVYEPSLGMMGGTHHDIKIAE